MPRRVVSVVALVLFACGDDSGRAVEGSAAASPDVLASIVATCSAASGTVEVRRRTSTYWEPVAIGTTFRDGDWIRSGEASSARIRLASGGHLELDPQSVLLVEEVKAIHDGGAAGGVRVSMESGSARGVIDPSSSSALVVGPAEREAARLTSDPSGPVTFHLRAASGATEVTVDEDDDAEAPVEEPVPTPPPPPTEARVARTAVPRPPPPPLEFPRSLLPSVDERLRCPRGGTISLSWEKAKGASGYRVMVATDLSFRTVVKVAPVRGTTYQFAPPDDGAYAWRVASRAGTRRYSEYGFARRFFCVPDAKPPVPKRPAR